MAAYGGAVALVLPRADTHLQVLAPAAGLGVVLLLFALWSHFKPSADDEGEEEAVPPEVAARLAELQATATRLQDRVTTLEKEIESETKPR